MRGRSASTSDVDALFQLPLDQFTAARNALVAQLKKAGRQTEANEAKALAKPPISAWVVNQLYWRHRESFDRMIEAGDRLRRAQTSQLTNEAGRAPLVARREAVTALAEIAARILAEGGHAATRDLLRRVTSTLEALSTYGSQPEAPVAGRLTNDLEPPGFEAVAGFLPANDEQAPSRARQNARSPSVVPMAKSARPDGHLGTKDLEEKERMYLLAAAKAGVREAERALSAARKAAERAAARFDTAAKRAEALEAERARSEKRLVQATKDADAANHDASDAAASSEKATEAAEAAERARDLARQQLKQAQRGQD